MTSSAEKADQARLDALHEKLERLGLHGLWQVLGRRRDRPQPRLWRWADIYSSLMDSAEVMRLGNDTVRRNIGMDSGARTINMGFQVVMPGETAAAHRHTLSAFRFVVQGQGAYTTANGEQMFMEPGDLLTQPGWVWHDHNNVTDEPIIWIDGLDAGLVGFLEAAFREDWAEGIAQPITKSDGYSRKVLGHARRPTSEQDSDPIPFHYRWSDTLRTLEELAAVGESDPHDGVLLEYTNPMTGGHAYRTMSVYIQMLRPGEATRPHRHTGTTLYHAVRGEGVTTVDKENAVELDWGEKDSFMVPSWRWHQHRNSSKSEQAILFSECDRPVLEVLGLHREENG